MAHVARKARPPPSPSPPIGPEWLREIKHDGYMLAHHDGARVCLISRRGLDWVGSFLVAAPLPVRSCIVDGTGPDRTSGGQSDPYDHFS
jgi:bifunctional non-homologous end joining protein LigD